MYNTLHQQLRRYDCRMKSGKSGLHFITKTDMANLDSHYRRKPNLKGKLHSMGRIAHSNL